MNNNLQQLKRKCLEEIERAYEIVENHYNVKIPRVPVQFSSRMTKCGGTASYRQCRLTGEITPLKIKLSLPLLKLNGEKFVLDTPGHEAMHIATYAMWNYAGHGPKWTGLMRLIERCTNRTHNMKVVETKGVPATCGCPGKVHNLSKVRANKMRRGAGYTCRLCRTSLTLGRAVQAPAANNAVTDRIAAHQATTKATEAPKPKLAKSDIVRDAIATVRANGISLEDLLNNTPAMQVIAQKAELTMALARTYVKNNWRKV